MLDGAMGTMIQHHRLTEADFRNEELKDHPYDLKGNNDLLSVTRPEIIKEIHAEYFAAGADIVETNSFSGTSIAQADYGLQSDEWIYKINFESAKIAKEVANHFTEQNPNKPRFVAGSMGPTNRTASMSPDVNDPGSRAITFNELKAAFKLQAKALAAGGADTLFIETAIDTLNVKAALYAIEELKSENGLDIPVMVSGTITDASGRTLSGQTTEAFLISVSHVELLSIGLNCALGAEQMRPYLKILSDKSDVFISTHPNAGLPNEFGGYDDTPESMAAQLKVFLDEGILNILGGCCGTTPDHIAAMAELAANYQPRVIKASA